MNANILKDRVRVGVRASVMSALGETVVWGDLGYRFARVIPLSTTERIAFQQLKSEVSHKIVMRGTLDYPTIPKRFLWKDKILETTESPMVIKGDSIIEVKEVIDSDMGSKIVMIVDPADYMKKKDYDADDDKAVDEAEGVKAVETLPGTGNEGQIVLNQEDNHFYIRINE